jgi:hypothetical protein
MNDTQDREANHAAVSGRQEQGEAEAVRVRGEIQFSTDGTHSGAVFPLLQIESSRDFRSGFERISLVECVNF